MGLVSKIFMMFLTVPTLFLPSGTPKTFSMTNIYIYVPYVPSILYINILLVYLWNIGDKYNAR